MAIKLERIVKTYYETLEEGKVLGRKCPVCGNVEWPPVYACNACGAMETEWYEMCGKGYIVELYMPTPMSLKPAYKALEPYAYAWIKCEEGPERDVMVRGVTRENEAYIRAHMPYPCHFDIVQREGYKTAVFAIDPIDADGNPIAAKAEKPVAAAPAAEASPRILDKLIEMVAKEYKKPLAALSAATNFEKDLKAPSLVFVGLVAKLEDEFDTMISISEASTAKTVGALALLIGELLGEEVCIDAPAAGEAAEDAVAAPAAEAVDAETLERLLPLVAKSYKKDISQLSPATNFEKDLKAPSLIFVGLIAKLEDEFDVMISISEASTAKTVGELADLIKKLVDEEA